MCLVLFSYKTHPGYPLVIAANRDEFYSRPTSPAGFWKNNSNILAGRDLVAGGTWMGVTKTGRMALLTNYRDLSHIIPDAPSRGKLVSDFLRGDQKADTYLKEIDEASGEYNGFNLLCGELNGLLFYYSNYQNTITEIEPGIHGLSNSVVDDPWPKVTKGKKKLEECLNQSDIRIKDLFDTLYDDVTAPADELPDTGVGKEKEMMLSPMFIKSKDYGSRCSTVLLVDSKCDVTFAEKTYTPETFDAITRTFQFTIAYNK